MCIYHSVDIDGWLSAAIVKRSYPDAVLMGYNYGNPIRALLNEIKELGIDIVFMTDISLPKEYMVELAEDKDLIFVWLDHHISAIDAIKPLLPGLNGTRDTKRAACELTWEYLNRGQAVPYLVEYAGLYDSFRHKGSPQEKDVWKVQLALRAMMSNPEEALKVLNDSLDGTLLISDLIASGSSIEAFMAKDAESAYYSIGYLLIYNGIRFFAINRPRFNPINYGIDYHRDGYDAVLSYHYDGKEFHYSVYNENGALDCSSFASVLGGGGHRGAAGFRLQYILPSNIYSGTVNE